MLLTSSDQRQFVAFDAVRCGRRGNFSHRPTHAFLGNWETITSGFSDVRFLLLARYVPNVA